MKVVITSLYRDAGTVARDRGASDQAACVFGRHAVFIEPGSTTAFDRVPHRTAAVDDAKRLYVVGQKGRLFQRAHPDVEVLLDRGRFLLTALPPDHPAVAGAPDEPCFRLWPLEPGAVVFRELSPVVARLERLPRTLDALDLLSSATFFGAVESLTGLRTRFSTSDLYREAIAFAERRFAEFGYETARTTVAMPDGGESLNLIADRPGSDSAAPQILVVAHLDSINIPEGPEAAAPGADDNASGSAGAIAMAEALRQVPAAEAPRLRFVLFGGEEQGLFGSRQYVEALPPAERQAIKAVINMDMIANINIGDNGQPVAPGVLLEGAQISEAIVDRLSAAAAAYTDLQVQVSFNPFASDHVPFIDAGIPAVLTIEAADQANDRIHTAADTIDHIDVDLAYQILRMNTAFVSEA